MTVRRLSVWTDFFLWILYLDLNSIVRNHVYVYVVYVVYYLVFPVAPGNHWFPFITTTTRFYNNKHTGTTGRLL